MSLFHSFIILFALFQRIKGRPLPNETEDRLLIVGGQDASPKEYPYFTQGSGCGASLIWKDVVLTAAHCKGRFSDTVLVGARQSYREDLHSELIHVAPDGEITHPDFDGRVYKDYMIVLLDREVTNHNIELVGLAGDDMPLYPGEELTAVGFGDNIENGQGFEGADVLQEVQVDYVSDSECHQVYGDDPAYDRDYMFCAGGTAGRDTCSGDSGGPIVKDGYQVGIVSWGFGCGRPNIPGVYATVSAEIEWIKQTVCENAANPPHWACEGGTSSVPPSKIPFSVLGFIQRLGWSVILLNLSGIVLLSLTLYLFVSQCLPVVAKDDALDKGDDDDATVADDATINVPDVEYGRTTRPAEETMPDEE